MSKKKETTAKHSQTKYKTGSLYNNNNSILYYLCAESTATRPITDTAQCR
jgi:hypothetical protein